MDETRPVARTTIDELLADARRRLRRLTQAMRARAVLIDIRADSQVARDGTVAGALVIPRSVPEWRVDPASEHRHPSAPKLGDHLIVIRDKGHQSSLAAAPLTQLGFARATAVKGGFQACRAAGLPVEQPGRSG
jgi:rhodanese-related sulfurtransferase